MLRYAIISLALVCTGSAAQKGMTWEEFLKDAEKERAKQKFIQEIRADQGKKTAPASLPDEEKKARAAEAELQRSYASPIAQAARSPHGLLIVGFTRDGSGVAVKLKNLTASSTSVDGTKLRGLIYDTQGEVTGGAAGFISIDPGKTAVVKIGFIGNSRPIAALAWADVSAWTDPAGAVYADATAFLERERERRTAIAIKSRAKTSPLVPVKAGYVPVRNPGN